MDDKYPPDWDKRRRTIFKRYDYECQGCHDTFGGPSGTLHAHHVRPISEGGGHGLDNLLPLCEDCHQKVHSSCDGPDLVPRERYDCVHCGGVYIEGQSVAGSYCCEDCHLSHRAEKQLNYIDQNDSICSTCYAEYPPSADTCPNCNNWNPCENNRSELGSGKVDAKNLIRHILKQYRQ